MSMLDTATATPTYSFAATGDSSSCAPEHSGAYLGTPMTIVEREPGEWTLLTYHIDYYLDVRCKMGPYYLHLLLKLDASETGFYAFIGRQSIESIAARVRSMPHLYYSRNETVELQQLVGYAIANPFDR